MSKDAFIIDLFIEWNRHKFIFEISAIGIIIDGEFHGSYFDQEKEHLNYIPIVAQVILQ